MSDCLFGQSDRYKTQYRNLEEDQSYDDQIFSDENRCNSVLAFGLNDVQKWLW
jgi:hypothetical protein